MWEIKVIKENEPFIMNGIVFKWENKNGATSITILAESPPNIYSSESVTVTAIDPLAKKSKRKKK